MLVSELLFEETLFEKLGNLRSLNVGSMINILKQGKAYVGRGRDRSVSADAAGSRFGGGHRGDSRGKADPSYGDTSEIINVGVIKGGIGGLRKAYKEHEGAVAFALYVNDKAVCFGLFEQETLGGSSRTGVFAWDLSQFQDKIEKDYAEKRAAASEWERKHGYFQSEKPHKKISSYDEREPEGYHVRSREYDNTKRAERGEPPLPPLKNEIYHGKTYDTASLKSFIEELIKLADGSPITCKLVMGNVAGAQKRSARYHARNKGEEIYTGIEALKTRLLKYKISKKPTVDNIEDFIKKTLEKDVKVIQFGGRGWKTTPEATSNANPLNILNGHPFSISYSTVDPGNYDSLHVYYKFNKETGILRPYKATWDEHPKSPNLYKVSKVGVLDANEYLKDELKVSKLDKDTIIKAILSRMKEGYPAKAREMLNAARKGGYDYPEFAAIEKSLGKEDED